MASLLEKIVESHLAGRSDDELELRVDQVLLEDATGTMACAQFERLGCDRVRVPLAVSYVDHNVLQFDERNPDDHVYLRSADSHTTTSGAVGMLAIGAGATEVAVVMAGLPYVVAAPCVVGVRLVGALGRGSRRRTSCSSCYAGTGFAADAGRSSSSTGREWSASAPPAGRRSAT